MLSYITMPLAFLALFFSLLTLRTTRKTSVALWRGAYELWGKNYADAEDAIAKLHPSGLEPRTERFIRNVYKQHDKDIKRDLMY